MKYIHEAIQALEIDMGFWWPTGIFLKKLKNTQKNHRANTLGPICLLQIFSNNPSRGV